MFACGSDASFSIAYRASAAGALWAYLALGSVCASAAEPARPSAGAARIVKWVDDKGITHYGDSLPPQYAGRSSSVLNVQGMTVHTRPANDAEQNVLSERIQEQQRRDRALRASFTTADEIDLARDRNLQMDQLALDELQQRLKILQDKSEGYKRSAVAYSNRKRSLPVDLVEDSQRNAMEIAGVEAQMLQKQQNMDATRQRFDKDKQRFLELKAPQDIHLLTPALIPGIAP